MPLSSTLLLLLVYGLLPPSSQAQDEGYTTLAQLNYPTYLVVGGKVVRPGEAYRLAVVHQGEEDTLVRGVLTADGKEVAADGQQIPPNTLTTLTLLVPRSAGEGGYALVVEGSLPRKRVVFRNETRLVFDPRFLSILVETSRPLYRGGQTVRFRILMLQLDLQPYDDGVDVFIIDSDGFIMRRWLSAFTNAGVVSLRYRLPELVKAGTWRIRVKASHQVEEHNITVENYFDPLFEVRVELPPYVLDTDKYIEGKTYGIFGNEKLARGNMTLKLFSTKFNEAVKTRTLVWKDRVFVKSTEHEVKIPLVTLEEVGGKLSGRELRLEVAMRESLYAVTATGYSKTRVITSHLTLRFLTSAPAYFKPGMLFQSQVEVSYEDNERVAEATLAESEILLEVRATAEDGSASYSRATARPGSLPSPDSPDSDLLLDPLSLESYAQRGVVAFHFITPNNTRSILITAEYRDKTGERRRSKLRAERYSSGAEEGGGGGGRRRYLGVWTSTERAAVGEYAVFHVKSNFWMSRFHYLVISKNQVVSGGDVSVDDLLPTTTTFPLATSQEMAPGFRLLVFHLGPSAREILADALFLPLNAFTRYETTLRMNKGKDYKGDRVEMVTRADEGCYVGIYGIRASTYMLQAGNHITHSRLSHSLISFELFNRSVHYALRQARNGTVEDQITYYPSMDYGSNLNRTFSTAGLVVFSQNQFTDTPPEVCGHVDEGIPCADSGCYTREQRCDGKQDCADLSDEMNCPPRKDNNYEYRINRISRFTDLYDSEVGDWAWQEVKTNDHAGNEHIMVDVPFVTDTWYFTAFALGPKSGFTVIKKPLVYESGRPLMALVSGPESCHRGEQVGLRVVLQNQDTTQSLVFLRLLSSPDYKFVHVEAGGLVSSYGARLSSGDHQLLVYIAPESQEQIDIPVAATVEQGTITVKLVASSQSARAFLEHQMEVLPEGGAVSSHTSMFLDLKNRAFVLNYMDIIVEESPIVPYEEWRRYVYGSPKASVTISGDLIGPIFPEKPLTKYGMLGMYGKGTDARVFELSMNMWTLHYLRETSRLSQETLKEVLDLSTSLFAHIMKRFNPKGWFTNWDTSQPSVWLTAWVLRSFKYALYSDWENVLYIEQGVLGRSVEWLVTNQSPVGSFIETPAYFHPLDSKMKGNGSEVGLTAHVALALCEVVDALEGRSRAAAVSSVGLALRYLEIALPAVSDAYQLALTAYALTRCGSNSRELAYNKLHALVRETTEGLYYWSSREIPANPVKLENQRPFTQPRSYTEGDSEAVEATAYALLVHLHKNGVTPLTDKVLHWLLSAKMSVSGFVSTTDTIVAMQAITEYVKHANIMDLTKIDVNINVPHDPGARRVFHIGNYSSSSDNGGYFEIEKVWGHVNVVARGAGLALVQLDVSYGVDYETLTDAPSEESFRLDIREYYSTTRNKSAITVQSCLRWVREWPEVSGGAVLEVDIPTGYRLVESEAEDLAARSLHPTLRDGRTLPGKTVWYFDHIPRERTCFNHTVRRWYPVANMTLYRSAILYEITARERFVQVLVNSTPLYILNICEVCGSYQCPYCPYYNAAPRLLPSPPPPALLLLATTLFSAAAAARF